MLINKVTFGVYASAEVVYKVSVRVLRNYDVVVFVSFKNPDCVLDVETLTSIGKQFG